MRKSVQEFDTLGSLVRPWEGIFMRLALAALLLLSQDPLDRAVRPFGVATEALNRAVTLLAGRVENGGGEGTQKPLEELFGALKAAEAERRGRAGGAPGSPEGGGVGGGGTYGPR